MLLLQHYPGENQKADFYAHFLHISFLSMVIPINTLIKMWAKFDTLLYNHIFQELPLPGYNDATHRSLVKQRYGWSIAYSWFNYLGNFEVNCATAV